MFVDVSKTARVHACRIAGLGHTELPADMLYDNPRFVTEVLTELGRHQLFTKLGNPMRQSLWELVRLADAKFIKQTGIRQRYIFPGTTAELATLAARDALNRSSFDPNELDAIIVGTNTGMRYPSTPDWVKRHLDLRNAAMCCDVQEACPSGAMANFLVWTLIRSGAARSAMHMSADRTKDFASRDEFAAPNLFGMAAGCTIMTRSDVEQFQFFDIDSDPHGDNIEFIGQRERLVNGVSAVCSTCRRPAAKSFSQNGAKVHEYVATVVPERLAKAFDRISLDPATVDHFIPHQPSAKTLDFLIEKLYKRWPNWQNRDQVHPNIEEMGNTSAACTGWLLSKAAASGQLHQGQTVVVSSFGSGMSLAQYGLTVL